MSNDSFRGLIAEWNNTFVLDKWFRKKYNLAFNSPAHRESCLIDIYWEYQEDRMFEEFEHRSLEKIADEVEYAKGNWLKPRALVSKTEIDLFDNLDLGAINTVMQDNGPEPESE